MKYTLFETMRTIQGGSKYEYELEHKQRLLQSANKMKWNHAKSSIQAVFNTLQHLAPFRSEKRIKVCVNDKEAWFEVSDMNEKEHDCWKAGVVVRDVFFERPDPFLKYETDVYQQMMPKKKDIWQETLFIDTQGYVLEGNISNVFFVFKNTWVTPSGEGVLPGIIRAKLIQQLQKKGIRVEQRPVLKSEAIHADHIFITNSIKDIVPVVGWGDKVYEVLAI